MGAGSPPDQRLCCSGMIIEAFWLPIGTGSRHFAYTKCLQKWNGSPEKDLRMGNVYQAIIVGARCAGSPPAMLLARKGYRVLLVDRATFPSDTLSTHVVQPLAVAALSRWGLGDRLSATGCPPIHTYTFDFGPVTLSGTPGTEASPIAYCARPTILDKLLVDAAAESGAEVRQGFSVEEVLFEDGRV